MTEKKILFIYTKYFPYGVAESFLENEIEVLSKRFSKIFVLPEVLKQGKIRKLPENVECVTIEKTNASKLILLSQYFFLSSSVFLNEIIKDKNRLSYIKSLKKYIHIFLSRIEMSISLQHRFGEHILLEATHYSYWTEGWATVLSIMKRKHKIKKLVSRVHGYDLFIERRQSKVIPFRYLQFREIDKVVAVSNHAYAYLVDNHPKFKYKFSTYPLGVEDHSKGVFEPKNMFTIVSCSNIIPLKRVHIIPDSLSNISFNIKWVHIGGGDIHGLLEKCKTLPKNIEYELKGELPNNEVIQFYKTNHVNLFLHLSESEGGIPVSIQEAISFGIPIIATKAGGIPEIVNDETGILLSKSIDAKTLTQSIIEFKDSSMNSVQFRSKVRKYALTHFSSENNFNKFVDDILLV